MNCSTSPFIIECNFKYFSVHGLHAEVRHCAQLHHLPQEGDERQRESNRTGTMSHCT